MNSRRSKIAFFILAVITGLFISQHLLQARAPESPVRPTDKLATKSVLETEWDANARLEAQAIKRKNDEKYLFPITSSQVRPFFNQARKKGKPFFYLSLGRLYGIDDNGKILGPVLGTQHADVPVVTGNSLKFNINKKCLAGESYSELIEFMQQLDEANSLLFKKLSEINISEEVGMIAYVNWSPMMPIIIGKKDIPNKIRSLNIFFDQLGSSELSENARYLDLRLNGKILVKKLF